MLENILVIVIFFFFEKNKIENLCSRQIKNENSDLACQAGIQFIEFWDYGQPCVEGSYFCFHFVAYRYAPSFSCYRKCLL